MLINRSKPGGPAPKALPIVRKDIPATVKPPEETDTIDRAGFGDGFRHGLMTAVPAALVVGAKKAAEAGNSGLAVGLGVAAGVIGLPTLALAFLPTLFGADSHIQAGTFAGAAVTAAASVGWLMST